MQERRSIGILMKYLFVSSMREDGLTASDINHIHDVALRLTSSTARGTSPSRLHTLPHHHRSFLHQKQKEWPVT